MDWLFNFCIRAVLEEGGLNVLDFLRVYVFEHLSIWPILAILAWVICNFQAQLCSAAAKHCFAFHPPSPQIPMSVDSTKPNWVCSTSKLEVSLSPSLFYQSYSRYIGYHGRWRHWLARVPVPSRSQAWSLWDSQSCLVFCEILDHGWAWSRSFFLWEIINTQSSARPLLLFKTNFKTCLEFRFLFLIIYISF